MPLATHPGAQYEIVLSTDEALPKGKQPKFIFHYLSVLEWEKIAKVDEEFDKTTDAGEMIDLAFKVIKKTLCGWRNMKTLQGKKIPFDITKLKSMVTLMEATELMQAAISQRPSVEDKKKLDLPSGSDTDSSAQKTAKA